MLIYNEKNVHVEKTETRNKDISLTFWVLYYILI